MNVHVDEAGQQGAPAQVHLAVAGSGRCAGRRRDGDDALALDDHGGVRELTAGVDVEHMASTQKGAALRGGIRGLPGLRVRERGEGEKQEWQAKAHGPL